ncbi:MAG: hypothetical protein ACLP1X_04415 [Polyangiaceae bacterium]|jgi:hypothetical protein
MLDLYKKTFVPMQVAIWLVTAAVLGITRDFFVGAAFLAAMQVGSLLGAAWGCRLGMPTAGGLQSIHRKRG